MITSPVNRSDETMKVKKFRHKATCSLEVVGDSIVSSTSEDASNCSLLSKKSFKNLDSQESSHITFRILDDLLLNIVDEAKKIDSKGVIDGVLTSVISRIGGVSAREISSEILEGCIEEVSESQRASAEAMSREIVQSCVEEALPAESKEFSDDIDQSE